MTKAQSTAIEVYLVKPDRRLLSKIGPAGGSNPHLGDVLSELFPRSPKSGPLLDRDGYHSPLEGSAITVILKISFFTPLDDTRGKVLLDLKGARKDVTGDMEMFHNNYRLHSLLAKVLLISR